ncbi:MAG: 3'-5' exonuclease, partial [Actinomycetes bacterium]
QIVRLESDADLVKVITVHKSKGLEYPIVCLPFSCSFRQMERKNTSFVKLADEAGERQLLLQYDDDQLVKADRDRLREDMRLLYVTLTRARHALWLGFAALKVGLGKDWPLSVHWMLERSGPPRTRFQLVAHLTATSSWITPQSPSTTPGLSGRERKPTLRIGAEDLD